MGGTAGEDTTESAVLEVLGAVKLDLVVRLDSVHDVGLSLLDTRDGLVFELFGARGLDPVLGTIRIEARLELGGSREKHHVDECVRVGQPLMYYYWPSKPGNSCA